MEEKYLKKRVSGRPFREIVDSLQAGGCRVNDEAELRVSLGRSTYEIAKVGNDVYGLLEFYPHIKRGKKKKPGAVEEPEQGLENQEQEKNEAASE